MNESIKELEEFVRGGPRSDAAAVESAGDDPLPAPKTNAGVLRAPAEVLAQDVHIEGGPLQIELRGWEVAKAGPGIAGWEAVSRWRPNEVARRDALLSALWLENQARNRKQALVYRVRPIISVDFDAMFGQPTRVPDEDESKDYSADGLSTIVNQVVGPDQLILTADESVLSGEAPQVNWQLPVLGHE